MRKSALSASLLLPVALAQSPVPPAVTIYRSTTPAFTYTYPSDLVMRQDFSAMIARGMAGEGKSPDDLLFAKCLSFPIAAGKGLEGPHPNGIGLLILLKVDHKCLGTTPPPEFREQYSQMLLQLLKPFGRPLTEDAKTYQLDGHPAAFAQGSVQAKVIDQDTILHAASACALVAENTLCWLVADSSHKHMPTLVATPISFDGHPPVPLIPADLLQPW